MAKNNNFETVLDQIEKMLNESPVKSTFTADKALWNFPDSFRESQPTPKMIENRNVLVNPKPEQNDKQFKDTNKQVQLGASSTIQAAAYWQSKEYLVVSFKSGHTYSYSGVPLMTILIWEQAASSGSFFYHNIRMSYPYQKMG